MRFSHMGRTSESALYFRDLGFCAIALGCPNIAVAKAIRTNANPETLTHQYASLLPSALEPSAFCYTCCSGLDCSEVDKLQDSWKDQFQKTGDENRKDELVFALLTIKKAKNHWNQVQPSNEWPRSPRISREQLLLEIGRFYSEQSDNPSYHIHFLLKTLYEFV